MRCQLDQPLGINPDAMPYFIEQAKKSCSCPKCTSERNQVGADSCARMVLSASKQATDEAIRWLEMIEKHGVALLPKALEELRRKSAALGS